MSFLHIEHGENLPYGSWPSKASYSERSPILPNTPPIYMSVIMGKKSIIARSHIKQPSHGRNLTKSVFTTPSHSNGIQQNEEWGKDIHFPIKSELLNCLYCSVEHWREWLLELPHFNQNSIPLPSFILKIHKRSIVLWQIFAKRLNFLVSI